VDQGGQRREGGPTMMIVDTDNFDRDYPYEKVFLDGIPTRELANKICDAINNRFFSGHHSPRILKVVEDGYVLQPGFEP
jgi:hypothetical protein